MKKRQRKSKKKTIYKIYKDIVLERMEILYAMSVKAVKEGDIEYSRRLGRLIKELHQETRIKIPLYIKRGLCKRCNVALVPGITASIRLRSQGNFSYIVVRCLACGWIHRYPYKRTSKIKRFVIKNLNPLETIK